MVFEKAAAEDLFYWAQNDLKIIKKIVQLVENIQKTPFSGLGNPEPLKHELQGFWSRRINQQHRLVYKVTEETVYIISCRYHYS